MSKEIKEYEFTTSSKTKSQILHLNTHTMLFQALKKDDIAKDWSNDKWGAFIEQHSSGFWEETFALAQAFIRTCKIRGFDK